MKSRDDRPSSSPKTRAAVGRPAFSALSILDAIAFPARGSDRAVQVLLEGVVVDSFVTAVVVATTTFAVGVAGLLLRRLLPKDSAPGAILIPKTLALLGGTD
jgi:hypothetical protein